MGLIQHLTDLVTSFGAGSAVATLAVVLEFVLRMVPSQKPLSIAYGVGAAIKGLGSLCTALGVVLDKVLPQKLSQ